MFPLKCSQCGAKESPITRDLIIVFSKAKDVDFSNHKCSSCFREELLVEKEERSDRLFLKQEQYEEEREHLGTL